MKGAANLAFDTLDSGVDAEKEKGTEDVADAKSIDDVLSQSSELLAQIDIDSDLIRRANRELRAKVSDEEYQRLMEERNSLAHKSIDEDLSPKEDRRLRLLEWEIQGIESAKISPNMDALEIMVKLQEQLAQKLKTQFGESILEKGKGRK